MLLAAVGAAVVVAISGLAAACGGDDDAPATAAATQPPAPTSASSPATVNANETRVGSITVKDPAARATPNDVSAVYFTVTSKDGADRLVAAKSPVSPLVQIHETVTDGSSMRMQEIPGGLPLPAGSEVTLKPGGFHIMLLNLKAPLKVGDVLDINLTFEKAGNITIKVPVKEIPTASAGMGGMTTPGTAMGGGMGASPSATMAGAGPATPTAMAGR